MLASIIGTLPVQRARNLDPNIDCSCPVFPMDKSSIRVAFLLVQIQLVWLIINQHSNLEKDT